MMKWLTVMMIACSAAKPAAAPKQTAELAGRRAQMIRWLHDYQEAGVFPTDALGMPLSVFRDDKGVRCPMAELIHKSGRDDLVDAVVREDNAVRLADVHEGPLHDWMLGSGLTESEIAMVQGAIAFDPIQLEELREAPRMMARVRGRLEMAEAALTANTSHALEVAVAQLPHGSNVAASIRGKVVPASAIQPAAPIAVLPRRWQGITLRN